MALYGCRECGCEEVVMQDLIIHLKKEHKHKKGERCQVNVRLRYKGEWRNWEQREVMIK